MTTRILVITYIPSPYQVEFFNAIARSHKFQLQVAYLYPSCDVPIAKQWQQSEFEHDYLVLDDCPQKYPQLEEDLSQSNLAVFNYYRHPQIAKLMARCRRLDLPWCFWGERPGFRHSGFLGWLYRYWKLFPLHNSSATIWGVGNWGVNQYRREFGQARAYVNLPYFSNLNRFANSTCDRSSKPRIFLYSGALIKRKGVDLLAAAFCRLAVQFPQIRLHFVGDGELRPNLESKLAKHRDRVKFMGFQPWHKLPNYYRQAHILCVPSRYDGWGLVVPEGLAAGLPVISTTRTGAAIDLIEDRINGWLIDANCEESLYQAMYRAISLSSIELAQYSQSAGDRALEHSLSNGVKRFEQAANQTIEQFYLYQQLNRLDPNQTYCCDAIDITQSKS